MTIALAIGLVLLAIVLLSTERIPLEVSSVAIIVIAVLSGLIDADEALAGFGSETVVFIFALMALTQGLSGTGVMQIVGRRLVEFSGKRERTFMLMLLLAVSAFSAVASNTAVTAAFLPVATAAAAQGRMPLGKVLMPMAFSSMLGGTIFLFGTSTNLVVSAAMQQAGLERISFAELTPVGLPLTAMGLVVTLLLVRRMIPNRGQATHTDTSRTYITEVRLTPKSRLVGRELRLVTDSLGLEVLAVLRGDQALKPKKRHILSNEDRLIVAGSLSELLEVKSLRSLTLPSPPGSDRREHMVKVIVPPFSSLIGRTLREIRFSERYGMVVFGLHRHPRIERPQPYEDVLRRISGTGRFECIRLAAGDMLLLSGPEARARALNEDPDLIVLQGVPWRPPRYQRAGIALVIFAATVAVAGSRVLPTPIAGLTGLLLMIAAGCMSSRDAFRVDWRVLVLIGALLSLGQVMEKSGAGAFLAGGLLPLADALGPRGILAGVMALTILLSIPMSNQAAALIMLPVGLNLAKQMGVDPRTFAIGIALSASCAFMTPLEPSAALVFRPGGYRFVDFIRVGTPLTIMLLVFLTIAVPIVWPFSGR